MENRWLDLLSRNLRKRERVCMPVFSGSMAPALLPGGSVTIEPVTWRDCRAGDIIVIRDAYRLTAHRLLFQVRFGSRALLLEKGDANRTGTWIRGEQVVGIVVCFRSPEGGVTDLRSAAWRLRSRRLAVRQLVSLAVQHVLRIPRGGKRWLGRVRTGGA